MRHFFVLMFVLIAGLAMSLNMTAQEPTVAQKQEVNTLLNEYQTKLAITKTQREQLAPVMLKQKVLIGKLCELAPTDEKWLEANKEVQALQTQVDGILTEEQRKAKQEWIKVKSAH